MPCGYAQIRVLTTIRLRPVFLCDSNACRCAMQAGNEAVLRARFEDARFFYEDDLAKPLAEFRPLLAGTVFHKQLGTLLDKSVRSHGGPLHQALHPLAACTSSPKHCLSARAGKTLITEFAWKELSDHASLPHVDATSVGGFANILHFRCARTGWCSSCGPCRS